MKNLVFILSLVLIVSGCANETKSSAVIAIDDLESMMQTLYCERFIECKNVFYAELFSTTQECIEFFTEEGTMEFDPVVEKVKSGDVEYDGKKADECIDAMKELGCKIFDIPSPEICLGTFTGTIADGGECTIDAECESRYCDIQQGCPGKCTPQAEAGEACNAEGSSCVHGADCNGEKCVEFTGVIADGKSCDEAFLWCGENSYCMEGKCQPKLKEGDNCEAYQDACGKGMFCSPEKDNNVCVKGSVVEEAGAVCDYTEGSICNPLKDLYCHINYETYAGTCGAAKKEGDDCLDTSTKTFYQCEDGLFCKIEMAKGTCTKLKDLGETCLNDNECESGYCDEGECTGIITECE